VPFFSRQIITTAAFSSSSENHCVDERGCVGMARVCACVREWRAARSVADTHGRKGSTAQRKHTLKLINMLGMLSGSDVELRISRIVAFREHQCFALFCAV
jgi:hypothetical protein